MKKIISFPIALGVVFCTFSCNKEHKADGTTETKNEQPEQVSATPLKGDYCFLRAENKDSTFVHLTVSGNNVKGEMTWQPWEKDGATGTLSGKLISDHEMELLYDYTIEGSKQTETKIMKIENGKLYGKTGELTDPENDGHLVYKDASKAVYSEVLDPAPCK